MSFCIRCDNQFIPNSTKQIYCSVDCRQESSREKILERYHIKKRQNRIGRKKKCAGGCGTIISIYNDSGMCDNCLVNKNKFDSFIKDLKGYIDYEKE